MDLDLKHIHKVKKRLADGSVRCYYFHRLTGKKIDAEYGTLAFVEAYKAAGIKDAVIVPERATVTFADILKDYTASQDFLGKAISTQKQERPMLAKLADHWGTLPALALNEEAIRGDFLEWRDEIAARSARQADYYIGLLRTVIQWGWDRRKYGIVINHAARPGRLHTETRIDITWPRDKALLVYQNAPDHLRFPFMFAFHTAWRQADILSLDFSKFDGVCFSQAAVSRTKKKVPFFAPCTKAMFGYLASIGRDVGPVFLNASGRPWYPKSFQNEFGEFLRDAGIEGLHFHDARGTVQTVLGEHGLSDLQISSITGHKLKEKNQILGSYANRTKLMAQRVIETLEKTWLADIGADLIGHGARQKVVRIAAS